MAKQTAPDKSPEASTEVAVQGSTGPVLAEKQAVKVEKKAEFRKPKLGDGIIYRIGQNSKRAGELRYGHITNVISADPENLIVQFNIECVYPEDFPKKEGTPNYPIAPMNTAKYDPDGAYQTWRYAD